MMIYFKTMLNGTTEKDIKHQTVIPGWTPNWG